MEDIREYLTIEKDEATPKSPVLNNRLVTGKSGD